MELITPIEIGNNVLVIEDENKTPIYRVSDTAYISVNQEGVVINTSSAEGMETIYFVKFKNLSKQVPLKSKQIFPKSNLQKYIAYWSYKIFGKDKERILANTKHLQLEAQELLEAVQNKNIKNIGEELADIVQLAYDIADRHNIFLDYEIKKKMDIVRARTWLPPDKEGIIRHAE